MGPGWRNKDSRVKHKMISTGNSLFSHNLLHTILSFDLHTPVLSIALVGSGPCVTKGNILYLS